VIGDLMSRWISETGEGSTRDLRGRAAWAARTINRPVTTTETGRWLRDLCSLGHIEVDWEGGRWSACPLVVTRLPGRDGYALLAGPRTAAQDAALDATALSVHRVAQRASAPGHLDRPATVLLQFDGAEDLRAAARQIGADWVPCAGRQLAALLPPLRFGGPAAPPSDSTDTLEGFDPDTLGWSARSGRGNHADGAYRLTVEGRSESRYFRGGQWHHCDWATAVYTHLHQASREVIQWRPDTGTGRGDMGTVFTDWGAPLPPLHQRSLVLSTGFAPRFSVGARTAAYRNVPHQVAAQVAAALRQPLAPG
jgi:hypothetical protein